MTKFTRGSAVISVEGLDGEMMIELSHRLGKMGFELMPEAVEEPAPKKTRRKTTKKK